MSSTAASMSLRSGPLKNPSFVTPGDSIVIGARTYGKVVNIGVIFFRREICSEIRGKRTEWCITWDAEGENDEIGEGDSSKFPAAKLPYQVIDFVKSQENHQMFSQFREPGSCRPSKRGVQRSLIPI